MITANNDNLKSAGFYWRTGEPGIIALSCTKLDESGFTNGFSTRLGGTSQMPIEALNLAGFNDDTAHNIHENRRRFLSLFKNNQVKHWKLGTVWQVHGADIMTIKDYELFEDKMLDKARCDGLVTNLSGVLIGVKAADCVPVLLADPRTKAIGVVHAGWRGTSMSIVTRAIENMSKNYDSNPNDLIVAIGPAASVCCYEIGQEVIDVFIKNFDYSADLLAPTRASHALINLKEANRRQLIDSGVQAGNICCAPLCTICRNDLFFSYRREKKLYGKVGRLLSVIGHSGHN
ncbi:MAG: peptidoglycan editing factor PgeF [Pyrinomonadaceae bacterium]